jgi:LPXTG-motif cell wall-anchored protein
MESLLKRIERNRREHDRLIALILCLSLIVSMGTFAVFHKKAVAKTYIRQVLDCPLATEGAGLVVHTHNDDCFDENHNLVCTLPELEAHTHTDACYTEVRVQVCGLAESVGHVHGSDCRTLMLTCEEEEREKTFDEEGNMADPGHIHTPDCYSEVLSCGMEEGDGAHTHTDACYETEYVLACDKPEIRLHVHTDDCYQKNEDGSIYVDEDGFSWLICGLPEIIQHAHGPECFKIYELDDGEPEEADEIVAADEIAAEPAEDTETAESIDEEKTDAEESGDKENTELTETQETKESTDTRDIPVPAADMPAQSWERTAGGIKVTVEAPEGAFPENTRIAVTPVNGSSLMDTVSDAVNGEVLEVQAVDITFFDSNGREIEPAIPIRVVMTPAATEHAEEKTNVVHIDLAQQTAEVIEQAEGTETDNSEVVFDAEAFTIYAIVYTVHFEYEVNGQVYTSTVPGAQDKLLSELIRELNVVNEEQLPEFMTKIREVSFSNPEVLKITETEGDWIIRPLKDSDQEEGLTIVMQDGATFRITVEAEGITEVSDENEVATVSTVNDLYLPASSEVKAELLTEEQSGNAIAAVQTAAEGEENGAAVESATYQAFSIALENVDVTAYDGFNVAVALPENAVVGRDFQLYQVKEDGTATDLTESLTITGEQNENGLQNVSGICFTTEDFADFVLSYSIETNYTSFDGKTFKITLNYGPKAGIPEGADLKVKEILPEDESYINYLNKSAAKLGVNSGDVSFARFFDIEIQKDGEKIEPKAPVQVTISLTDAPEENVLEDLKVLHFAQNGPETIDATQAEQKEGATIDLSFETDGFSVYGVVYTVDFHWEVDGKVYKFSIPGGGYVSLEHLVEVLGIHVSDTNGTNDITGEEFEQENDEGSIGTGSATAEDVVEAETETGSEDDNGDTATTSSYEQAINLNSVPVSGETRAFVADIETVEFSSPELVWVGKVYEAATVGELKVANGLEVEYSTDLTEEQITEINAQAVEAGDWALISIHPFTSEETLTVTMKNGDQFVINVTDAQIKTKYIDAAGDTWEIIVTYDDNAQIPDGAELKVREITEEDQEYSSYYQNVMAKTKGYDYVDTQGEDEAMNFVEAVLEDHGAYTVDPLAEDNGDSINFAEGNLESDPYEGAESSLTEEESHGITYEVTEASLTDEGQTAYIRFFDIEIWANDQRIEPKAEVSVTISLADVPQDIPSDLQVVHFAKDGTEVMETKKSTRSKDEETFTEISFVTDEFSVYSVTSTASGTVDNLLNKSYVLVCNGVALSPEQNTTQGYTDNLRGIPVTVSNGTISTNDASDSLPVWTVERYHNDQYRYRLSTIVNGETRYLNLQSSNGGGASVSAQEQILSIETRNNSQYRFRLTTTNHALDLFGGSSNQGFGSYDGNRDYEFFTLYELGDEIIEKVTIHFVDRDGNPLSGVSYTGSLGNQLVIPNEDGTFSVPYNWHGTTGTVNVSADFAKSGYTYANTHLAKNTTNNSWTGSNYNQNGILIESVFTSNGHSLSFRTDKGDNQTYATNGHPGDYDFSASFTTFPPNDGTEREYAVAGDKDVYVVLDPVPSSGSSGSSGSGSSGSGSGSGQQPEDTDPQFKKQVTSNGDGTYNLALSVTGRASNHTEQPKANILLVVDTSSSMVSNNDPQTGHTRLEETQTSLRSFGEKLFKKNGTGEEGSTPADTVQVAMISFDSAARSSLTWTTQEDTFDTAVDALKTNKGTNWEEALQLAYTTALAQYNSDHDPTFVVFFTDGEPSQYTNFHQTPHPSNSWKYFFAFLSREAAKDEAREIVSSGLRLYSMFAYGASNTNTFNGESVNGLLNNLVNYAYNSDGASSKYSYSAENASDMNKAFEAILHGINSVLGISDVEMNDSITSLTSIGASLVGSTTEVQGFMYTRTGGQYGSTPVKWDNAPPVTYDSDGIHWDLGNQVLEDGVTYTVNVTIWPSQQSYDYVTMLNNSESFTIDQIPEPDRSCFVYNSGTGKYEVVTNPESGPHGDKITNEINYTKTQSETVTELPEGASTNPNNPVVVSPGPDDWPRVTTKTWYTENGDGTWTKHVETDVTTAFNPPDQNMALETTDFKARKVWEVGRKEEIIYYLYDVTTGLPYDNHKYVTFVVNQIDDPDNPVKFAQTVLGYNETTGVFEWKGTTQTVTVEGHDYTVGDYWEKDLNISFGLILSENHADARGIYLDDPRYIRVYRSEADRAADNVAYYVLERGHDYKIEEPDLDFRFEFQTEVYHPMLVDGVPQSVKIQYKNDDGVEYGILEETDNMSWLQGRNILRGQLEMSKTVLDPAGNVDQNNDEVFEFVVTLENDSDPGPFYNDPVDPDEQNIPWYGVEDAETGAILYYHKIEPLEDGSILYVDELTACVNGNYNNGLKDGYAGNIMVQESRNKVTADIRMNAKDKWVITNVPAGTRYRIEEVNIKEGYEFVRAEQTGSTNKVEAPADPAITGSIPMNTTTSVVFTNQMHLEIHITKVDVGDLNKENPPKLAGAEFELQKYNNENFRGLDTAWGTNGIKTAVETSDNPGEFSFAGIPEGYYKLVETKYPDGYIGARGNPLFRVVEGNGRFMLQLLEEKADGTIAPAENNRSDTVIVNDADNTIKLVTFGNTPGTALPMTGGSGTRLFTILGSILIAGAGLLLWRRRRLI